MNFAVVMGVCVLVIFLMSGLEWIRDRIERRFSHHSALAPAGVFAMPVLVAVWSSFPEVLLTGLAAFVWLLMHIAAL
jgi:uncharacterized membrane protein YdjX (TVP38/TMEM64 family)